MTSESAVWALASASGLGIWIWHVLFLGDGVLCSTPTVCVLWEKRRAFPSWHHLNSDSLNSLSKEHLDTHYGYLHTRTYALQEGKVCYENIIIWLWRSPFPCACRTPWVLFDITTGCVLSVTQQNAERKRISLCSLLCLIFFLAQSPQIPPIFLRSLLLSRITMTSRACFLSLKRSHKPCPSFKWDVLLSKPRLAN